jgi:peptidase E
MVTHQTCVFYANGVLKLREGRLSLLFQKKQNLATHWMLQSGEYLIILVCSCQVGHLLLFSVTKGINVFVNKNWKTAHSALKYVNNVITSMAKLYFLGGENIVKRDSREINETAFRDAAEAPRVVVFPWARSSFDKAYKRRKRLFDYFRNLGASNVDFADYSDTLEEINRKVEGSDLIYLPGGLTSVLIERLKNKRVDLLLHKYGGVVVGRSAGALVLCKKCVITDRHKSVVKMISGLGLVDFGVKVHYKPLKDIELKRLSKEERIYAIPERSALVYDSGHFSFMGNVYLFQNGEKSRAD